MAVRLSKDLERLVQRKVASGHYRSADEVVSTALRALDAQEQELDARATTFQAEIERRLSEGPATVMDFAAINRSLREQAGTTKSALRPFASELTSVSRRR